MNGLRDVLESVNDVALTGLKSGMEIGERNAALKVKPLIEALEKLANEAQACAEMARPCIGNTNTACLLLRVTEAHAAVAAYNVAAR